MTFWIYVGLLHLLAAVGLFNLCRDCWFLCRGRRAKPPSATHEVEAQATLDVGHNQAAGSPAQRTQAAAQSAQPEAVVHATHVTVVTGAATPQVTVRGEASSVAVPGRDNSSHGAPSTAWLRHSTQMVSQHFPGRKPKHEATLRVETVAVEIIPPFPCAEHGNTSKAVARISRDPSHGGVLGCIAYS